MRDDEFIVTDENGDELVCTLLKTFEIDGVNYVFYLLPDGSNVMPAKYDDEGNLIQLTEDSEWDLIEEEFEAFIEEYEEQLENETFE